MWVAAAARACAGGGTLPSYLRPDRAAANVRLQDALTRYADSKPRTMDWLLKLIDAMYRGKGASDEQRAKQGQEPLSLVEYMFQHLTGMYGTRELVNQYSAQLVASVLSFVGADLRVGTFHKFLMEEWDTRVLAVYMDAMRKVSEPARVPCCDFPMDYVPSGGRKGDAPALDVRKALWVADKVLLRRAPKVAYMFAQSLNQRAEAVKDVELDSYFTAPGYYGADALQVRAFEAQRAEFRRISSAAFLDALCAEWVRVEAVLRDVLPEVHRERDSNADGWIVRSDVSAMLAEMSAAMAPPPGAGAANGEDAAGAALSEDELAGVVDGLWSALQQGEADARARAEAGGAGLAGLYPEGSQSQASGPSGIQHIGRDAFVEACTKSDLVRSWVRLHRTPHAGVMRRMMTLNGKVETIDEAALEAAREAARILVGALAARHWALHGPGLQRYFADAGGQLENQLQQQASILEAPLPTAGRDAKDGARRAAALAAVLRLLLVRKAERLGTLLQQDNLTSGPRYGPEAELEELMQRLTGAVQLLYGPAGAPWVVAEELADMAQRASSPKGPPSHSYRLWMRKVATRCRSLQDRLAVWLPADVAADLAQRAPGVQHWGGVWKTAAEVGEAQEVDDDGDDDDAEADDERVPPDA